jgi:DMSO/TMAO reductase YedYZ molybdopterin-dependent catalytic subunit
MKKSMIIMMSMILVSGCGRQTGNGLAELAAVEVREYQGERLGSVLDFRENSIKGPQRIDIDGYRLEVSGLVGKPQSLTYNEVLAFPTYSKVITLHCVEGWSVKILWEGVLLTDILKAAGLELGANTVIFHAYDGYTTSLPLAFIIENNILLAYKMNGVTLPPERGFPFQVVAESKLGYKWAKWVTKIEVSDDPTYKGFWESRGYDNQADI